jgi:hypothetical protein
VVDRYSPKAVLMVTKYVNIVLLGALAALVLAGGLSLGMVYGSAFAIGLTTTFSISSATSMLPHVMPRAQLPAANSVMMGLRQLSMFMGPLLACELIAVCHAGAGRHVEPGRCCTGHLLGAHGAGTLVGMAVSGARSGLRLGMLGLTMLVVDVAVGVLFMPMGLSTATWQGAALLGTIGVLGGFMQVSIFTWLQQRTPTALMGRVMSLVMFIFLGLAPLSGAFTGWLLRTVTVPQLFMGGGGLLVCLVLGAMVTSPLRQVADRASSAAGT